MNYEKVDPCINHFVDFVNTTMFTYQEIKRILKNTVYLSFLQLWNYLLPLITLPYLVKVLGPEKYGLVAFAQAFIQYFVILTDYGFNFSATREISMNRDDWERVSKIFISVMVIKMVLIMISFVMLNSFLLINKFARHRDLFYFSFGIVVGQAIFPIWFF